MPIGPRTEEAYYACVRQFSEFYGQSPDLLSPEQIRQYCIHLKAEKKVARPTSHVKGFASRGQAPRPSVPSSSSGKRPSTAPGLTNCNWPAPIRSSNCRSCFPPAKCAPSSPASARWISGWA
ncbi:MAG: phage integrase N-terminal SAM-like domain-containing protein [Chloroflexi bacterium]|nr:phage integrase N-terminal SAM-like domain-containing protein [Chloroflexota bacterium]